MPDSSVNRDEFLAVKDKVDDHDRVLEDLSQHFQSLSDSVTKLADDFGRIVGWFQDKRTIGLFAIVLTVLVGPEGVAQIKAVFGL